MSKLSEFVPGWLENGYRGMKFAHVIDDSDLRQYTEQLKEAKSWMEAESEMLAIAGQLDKEADAFEREWMALVAPVFPKQRESTCADFLHPDLRKAAATVGNAAPLPPSTDPQQAQPKPAAPKETFMQKAVQESTLEALKAPMAGALNRGIDSMIGAPTESDNRALSERLKNVQRQIMLEDLMTNDPVLGDESPEVVAQAYQTILGVAPDLASNKEIVRAILRQAVHSVAVSPYEAQVWTDLEKNIRALSGKADPQGRPMPKVK
jgi:hypothetical protein